MRTPTSKPLAIRRARSSDLADLTSLFEDYRAFYERKPARAAATRFLAQRLDRNDSLIWVAHLGGQMVGFVQVYPIFSSLSTRRAWLLNDLFVAPTARARGVGRSLLQTVSSAARSKGVAYVELATQHRNTKAQRLYAAEGYVRETEFQHWSISTSR